MKDKQLFYATGNFGKLLEVGNYLEPKGITLKSPRDLDKKVAIEESGSTLEENAILKAEAYAVEAPECIVMADDTGVEIDALDGEPGIKVRRWKDGGGRDGGRGHH